MNAHLMTNLDKAQAVECSRRIADLLHRHGCGVTVIAAEQQHLQLDYATVCETRDLCLAQSDVMIAVGGDGTIMHAAKHSIAYDRLILGVNAGHLGFLAQAEPDRLPALMERLLSGDYTEEKRIVLCASIEGGSRKTVGYALNDAVVSRDFGCGLIELSLSCNGKYLDSFRADGVIFATPTGSTAYSMSAGGPIVDPTVDAILMTPVCPHKLTARPLIFSASKELSVCSTRPGQDRICLSLDGGAPVLLEENERVTICKAPRAARFINFGEQEFFEVFSEKIVQKR